MAKDPAMGPISDPDGGFYGPPEEVPEEGQGTAEDVVEEVEVEEEAVEIEAEEILTQPSIFDLFGEKIGQLLLDAGYSSVDAVVTADDKVLLNIKDIGKAALKEIRGLAPQREIPEMILPAGIEAEQEEAPASARVRRIREASRS